MFGHFTTLCMKGLRKQLNWLNSKNLKSMKHEKVELWFFFLKLIFIISYIWKLGELWYHTFTVLFHNNIKIDKTLAQVFSYECCKISKNTFFYRTPPVAAPDLVTYWVSMICRYLFGSKIAFSVFQPKSIMNVLSCRDKEMIVQG